MAAAIEQFHDDHGIMWPVNIAPYEVVVLPVNTKDEELMAVANDFYDQFGGDYGEAVLDDRKERAGVKFNDADLIGYPVQLVVGKDLKANGNVEIKIRRTGEKEVVPKEKAVERVREILQTLRKENK